MYKGSLSVLRSLEGEKKKKLFNNNIFQHTLDLDVHLLPTLPQETADSQMIWV
jgi:hypothetical protein